jgi:acyl transferase domain-containing protein/NAD(P)-dependent dehydrogenase (short-subunit alcohol dehydrogenase family)/acyl carrier protein
MLKNNTNNTPVAIVGMGCLFARSSNLKSFWRLLFHGKDAITEVPEGTHWSPEDYFDPDPKKPDHIYCRRGGFLSPVDFDPTAFGIPPNVLESTDTSQLLALVAAVHALRDAGYLNPSVDHSRTSVVLGATGTQELSIPLGARLGHPHWRRALSAAGVPKETAENVIERISDAYVPWQETSFPGLLGNVVAGRVCNRLNLGGTNCVVDAACASSLGAVHLSLMELETGRSDMVLSGGVDLLNDIFMHMCFAKTGVLSHTEDIRPFSKDADGTVLGEGVGILALKRLPDAEHDGDTVYAVIKGMGTSSDGKSQSIYAPRKEGQEKALRDAYRLSGIPPATIGHLEAHGTGTRVGDQVEFQALKTVFSEESDRHRFCALGSVKSMIGHAKAAAGSAGLIKTALSLHHKVLPPTLKARKPDPNLGIEESPFYLSSEARPWFSSPDHPRRAAVSAFGFGGSNYHIVLEEYRKEKAETAWCGASEIFAFGAETPREIAKTIDTLLSAYSENSCEEMLSYLAMASRKKFNDNAPHRLLMMADPGNATPEEIIKQLTDIRAAVSAEDIDSLASSLNVYYGSGDKPGKLAFLFPGQGSQYVNMGRELVCMFPEAFDFVEKADQVFQSSADGRKLTDYIYPAPSMGLQGKRAQESDLRQTDIAQPAIGAVSMAMAKVLERFNVHPDACCGHSYGELTALCAAGWIDEKALMSLSIARGKCMAEAGSSEGEESGTMIVVLGPQEELEQKLKHADIPVVLANRNSPSQGVLSGPVDAIRKAEKACTEWGFSTGRLPVSAAFHSDIMAQARKPFSYRLSRIKISPVETDVYSNVSGIAYPKDVSKVRALLKDQLISTVNFLENLNSLYQDGVRTFVEVGPRTILTGLAKESLTGSDITALSMNGANGKQTATAGLAAMLCELAAKGYAVALDAWEADVEEPEKKRMRIPVTGANFLPKPVNRPVPAAIPPADADRPGLTPPHVSAPVIAKHDSTMKKEIPIGTSNMSDIQIPDAIARALQVAEQGLKSMQALQQQTAEAHQKFLETQAAAAKALQEMISGTRNLTGSPISSIPKATPAQVCAPSAVPPPPPPPAAPRSAETVPLREEIAPSPVSSRVDDAGTKKLSSTLLSVVSRLTGYPEEMLGLDMDIESDLGIDSIKRVEILSAMEEAIPGLPAVSPDIMGSLKTLGQIVAHFSQEAVSTDAPATPATAPAAPGSGSSDKIKETLLSVVSHLTGYPEEMLGLDMDIESDLGIDSIKRVEILSAMEEAIPGLPPVSPDMMGSLKTLGQIVEYLSQGSGATDTGVADSEPLAPTGSGSEEKIKGTLLSVVCRLTGYPEEMLGLDMDIESDLGIDSIKRVEILSAMEEAIPGLPPVSPDMMGSLKTLGLIVEYLSGTSATPSANSPDATASESSKTAASAPSVVDRFLVTPSASSPKAPSGKRLSLPGIVYVTDDGASLSDAIQKAFDAKGVDAKILSGNDIADIRNGKQSLDGAAGLVILPATTACSEDGNNPEDLSLLKENFSLVRHSGPSLIKSAAAGGGLLATVTRLDGVFGFTGKKISQPVTGGLSGLVKTAAIEWPQVRCKALDIAPEWNDPREIAHRIVTELLDAESDGTIEVGLDSTSRTTLSLSRAPISDGIPSRIDISTGDVVIVSGGARGVTAETALALARSAQPTLVLLGRSPEPLEEPSWLKNLTTERDIKAGIIANEFKDRKATPMEVEASFRRHASNREIAGNIEKMTASGSQVKYVALDIRNLSDVTRVLETVRKELGPIKGVLHGAGVLEDKLILDKSDEQFERVLETKVKGLQVLLAATREDPLSFFVLFSSVAARFGNAGQADYAMANEVLNKIARRQTVARPEVKTVSINWGPWDGGMVTDSLKQEFARKNIDLIPLEAGASYLVSEIASPDRPAEVVFGAPLQPVETETLDAPPSIEAVPAEPGNASPLKVMLHRDIDLNQFPVLSSHQLDGIPVVPFALLTEWIGHSALHDNPGLLLQRVDEMRLLKGIRMDQERKVIRLLAGKAKKTDKGSYEVDVEIRNGIQDVKEVLHSKAKALLSTRLPSPPEYDVRRLESFPSYGKSIREVYENVLFHGHALQGIQKIIGLSEKGMAAEVSPAPSPESWVQHPMRSRWIADPLVLDSAFQMACLWCYELKGMVSLPSFVASFRQYCRTFPSTPVTAVLDITNVTDHKMTADVTILDSNSRVAAELKGYEAIMDQNLFKAFKPELAKSA